VDQCHTHHINSLLRYRPCTVPRQRKAQPANLPVYQFSRRVGRRWIGHLRHHSAHPFRSDHCKSRISCLDGILSPLLRIPRSTVCSPAFEDYDSPAHGWRTGPGRGYPRGSFTDYAHPEQYCENVFDDDWAEHGTGGD